MPELLKGPNPLRPTGTRSSASSGGVGWVRAILTFIHLLVGPAIGGTIVVAQQWCPEPTGRQIAVSPGVRLHIVEWGGTGEPVLLLAGILASAHVFDEFAPLLTDHHRVVGITRRGIPPSDPSPTGYDAATLTADIVTVMDSLHILSAHVIGWSFGGNEAVILATTRATRVRSVVLLDSYDSRMRRAMRGERSPSPDAPGAAEPFLPFDSTSPLALQWRQQRLGNRPPPLSTFCTGSRFGPDGRYLGTVVPRRLRDSIAAAMRQGMPLLPYSAVRQPVLALFATPRAAGDMFPMYATMDTADRRLADSSFQWNLREQGAVRDRLMREIPHATVVEIPGAAHAIFRSHPEAVFLKVRTFLDSNATSAE
jgi:non-heme chloroperoxidase